MKRRFMLLFLVAAALAVILPAASSATAPNNASDTYQLVMDVPNVSQDAHGDTLAVTGHGTWSVHPKATNVSGNFTFMGADGTTFSGTWAANSLIAFQPYGCGVVHLGTGDVTLPPNFCGGRVTFDVTAMTPFGLARAQLTIFCIIGNRPSSVEEGIAAVIPSVGAFNRHISGMNHYVKLS
jgi:hypothetical protein